MRLATCSAFHQDLHGTANTRREDWLLLSKHLLKDATAGFVLVFYYMDWWKHLNKCHYFLVGHSSHWPEFFISKHIWDVKNLHYSLINLSETYYMSLPGFLTSHKGKRMLKENNSFTLKWSEKWSLQSKFSSCPSSRCRSWKECGKQSRRSIDMLWMHHAAWDKKKKTTTTRKTPRGPETERGGGIREPHHYKKFTDTTADSSWGLWSMSDLWLKENCQDRWEQAPSVSCGIFFQPIWLPDWGDIFQEGKITDVKRWLQWCFEVRRKWLGIKNNCFFLVSGGDACGRWWVKGRQTPPNFFNAC